MIELIIPVLNPGKLIEYIDKWSLLLDLNILVRTIPAVLKGSDAS